MTRQLEDMLSDRDSLIELASELRPQSTDQQTHVIDSKTDDAVDKCTQLEHSIADRSICRSMANIHHVSGWGGELCLPVVLFE